MDLLRGAVCVWLLWYTTLCDEVLRLLFGHRRRLRAVFRLYFRNSDCGGRVGPSLASCSCISSRSAADDVYMPDLPAARCAESRICMTALLLLMNTCRLRASVFTRICHHYCHEYLFSP